ncbi:MAG: carboxypeptidase M32 [Ardenticatenales bacterium]
MTGSAEGVADGAMPILQTDGSAVGPAFGALLTRIRRLNDLGKVAGLLGWDRDVNMPSAATPDRAQQMSTLAQVMHETLTNPQVADWLAEAEEEARRFGAVYMEDTAEAGVGDDQDSAGAADAEAIARLHVGALLREFRRQHDDAAKLPAEYVARRARLSAAAYQAWVEARRASDWASFQPHLAQTVGLAREQADYFTYTTEPYDALLDRYERGMTSAAVATLFSAARDALVPLREAIGRDGRPIDASVLHQPYPVAAQQAFAREIAEAVGYDFSRGHLGTAVHPFASSFSQNDCRITTRWYPEFINPSVFGTLHECGHAIYEMGTDPALARTPLARGTSSGIHESQSRMIENVVGRSRGFWRAHFGRLQAHFPSQLGGTSADDFWRAVNIVQPSLIRVEADELTYNLHIILRFEIERALISGSLQPADARDAWNDSMANLLGITPHDDANGILQDVHWSSPMYGYFPTYALGNLYAAQLVEAATERDPAVAAGLDAGEAAPLVDWMRRNVHRHGKLYPPAALIRRATGRPLDEGAFVRYATRKFGAVYGLA